MKTNLQNKDLARNEKKSIQILNIKLLPNNGPHDYINLLLRLKDSDYAVKLRGDRYIIITDIIPVLDDEMFQVNLLEFTSLDPDGFVDLITKEATGKPYKENLGANKRTVSVYFIPEAHRIASIKGKGANLNSIKKYFDVAVNRFFQENSIEDVEFRSSIEKSHNILEELQKAFSVIYLKANLSYTNKDHHKNFAEMFDTKISESGSKDMIMELKGAKNAPLNFNEDSLPSTLVTLSESNGSLEARIIKNDGEKPKKFNTLDYILELPILFNNNNFYSVIFKEVMSKFRPNH